MKASIALCMGLLCSVLAWSQHECASGTIHNHLLETDTVYYRNFLHVENRMRNMHHTLENRAQVVHTLPVVVHILHEGEALGSGSNISDEQIFSAIAAMNEDFRKVSGTNGDGDGVDVEIEFCLAVRDPDGNSTTGINRVDASVIDNYAEMGIEATGGVGADESAVKALSTWPREDYLNIWVVNEIEDNNASGGIQGYAYFPTDNPNDGIVILHNAFGTVGNLKPNTDMNRTLTHEMGHSFGLYHTFHNTDDCSEETNCETQGDRVCDTPVTPLSVSCSSPACSGTQQVENYMDYTSETCRNMFSQGQKDRMWATLLTDRWSLTESLGCDPVSDLDAGINTIDAPAGGQCDGTITPEISIANFGTTTLTSVTIEYGSGNYNNSYSWSGSLSSGNSESITLPAYTTSNGDQTFVVRTTSPNGSTDEIPANDASSQAFSVGAGAQLELTVTVDFFGTETSWEMRDASDELVAAGGPYINNSQGTEFVENMCFPEGCYDFIMIDEFGDGQSFTSGSYTLYDSDDTLLASGSGNWGAEAVHSVCVTASDDGGGPDVDPPVAGIGAESGTFCTSNDVDFSSTSTGENITIHNWTFEGGTPSASSLVNPQNIVWYSPGTYTVSLEVINAGGSHTTSTEITIHDLPEIALTATDVSCPGAGDGAIAAEVIGTGNYTLMWDTGANGANITGLDGGYYTVEVVDGSCQSFAGVQVDEADPITLNLVIMDEDCSGAPGTASVDPTGGTGVFSSDWSNGATSGSAGNLSAGNYSVTVTDALGCSASQSFSVAAAAPMQVTINTEDVTCHNGSDGSAEVEVSGGTGSLAYNWSTGANGSNLTTLSAGEFSVTVLDESGCSATESFTITEPSALDVSATATDVACHGEATGTVQAVASGGTGSHALSWSNGDSGTVISNVEAGNYTVTATDANGCTAQASATVEEPAALNVSIFKQDVTCYGLTDGSAQASASGGNGALVYSWDSGQQTFQIENVGAGSYTVTVTDENGCEAQESATVGEPDAIELNLTSLDIACGETHGSAYVDPAGGVGFYSVAWSNSATGLENEQLDAGTYSVEVTDANGCSTEATFAIAATESLVLEIDILHVSCQGMNDGEATVSVNGGDGNYTYTWTDANTGSNATGLSAGEHLVTVEDGNGCSGFQTFEVTEPEVLELIVFKTDITCFGMADGSASASANGGAGLYSFTWSNGAESQSIEHLGADNYTATVTDQNGCVADEDFHVIEPSALVVTIDVVAAEDCQGSNGSLVVNALGGTGDLTFDWNNGNESQMAQSLSSGTYSVTVTDSNGCSQTAEAFVPFDCENTGVQTAVDEATCQAEGLMLDDFVSCVPVEAAQMYQWKFENLAVGLLAEVYSAENNPAFWLADVPGLFYGISVNVSVRVMVDDSWGSYCDPCTIAMASDVPQTAIDDQDCAETFLTLGKTLECGMVLGASVYEWRFTHEDHIIVAETYLPELTLSESLELTPEAPYAVDVRAQVGPDFSAWGPACPMHTEEGVGLELSDDGAPSLSIYPNPGNGDWISLEAQNLTGGIHVFQCELYNAEGRLVEAFEMTTGSGAAAQHTFHQTLSTGVYILRYTTENFLPKETRLMVQ